MLNLKFIRNGLLAAALLLGTAASAAEPANPLRDPYLINPGDVLRISVWREEALSRELPVSPDGHIGFPLAGDIVAAGKTIEQLRLELTEKLSRLIPDASVTVSALQLQGNSIYVVGAVNRPGPYQMNRPTDAMQAIALAGGPTPFADLNDIKILRRSDNGRQIAIPFKFSAVQDGDNLEQNILLRAGDTVVIP